MELNLEWLQNNRQYILFESLYGSHAYGTATETSDRDIRGVYIMSQEEYYGMNYVPQIHDDTNDTVYYEIRKFCELLTTSNTTALELLFMPSHCIQYCSIKFNDIFIKNRNSFLTKDLVKSLMRMSESQISKATGLKKKMNYENQQILRKTPFDFCYVPYKQGSRLLSEWLEENNYIQENCGLVKVPNMRDSYCVFYSTTIKYKGVIKKDLSNDIALSSIPKGEEPLITMTYNKDAYTVHCKEYREYQEWLKNRNIQRYVDVDSHHQQIDGKNMLHTVRVIQMTNDLLNTGKLLIERSNREELLDIRRGKVSLKDIVSNAQSELENIRNKLETCTLQECSNPLLVNDMLIQMRTSFYQF